MQKLIKTVISAIKLLTIIPDWCFTVVPGKFIRSAFSRVIAGV